MECVILHRMLARMSGYWDILEVRCDVTKQYTALMCQIVEIISWYFSTHVSAFLARTL